MTEESCWQAIDKLLKVLEDDLNVQLGKLREAPFQIKSLQETRLQSLLEFLSATLEQTSRPVEDRLFLVEEILCGRLANLSNRADGTRQTLASYAIELHQDHGYLIFSRTSLERMNDGTLFQRFGFYSSH